ncbi:hypothetical protein [Planktothrix mougeotii]|uniref:PhnA-like protein n=1 Tax=Planktothrix mougeotii LEGE 06226 TaxID=1828728 RepID=A0ABR9U9M5_9CYAN|nr:hypothetical protein [Planktothrix mougeotii]MBE9142916.1 hypothetical protein [Planktothrix mougeotii LEGE 06226]
MAYTDESGRIIDHPVAVGTDYHDRVRWGPIFAGLVIAIGTQLILSGIGAAIGLTGLANSGAPRSNADDTGTAVGIWSIISLLIALFVGGWLMARVCGPMNRTTALLNGAILWATTLAISAWLLSSGVSGIFGIVASNAGEVINQVQEGGVNVPANTPNVTAQQAQDIASNAAKASWAFSFGSLLGLISTLVGSSVGVHKPYSGSTVQPGVGRPYAR